MWNHDVGFLPVVDARGRVVAAITDRDLCMAAYTQGKPLAEIGVDSAMSRNLVSVRPTDPLDRAAELMECHQVRRLPVVDDDGAIVGVVTLSDLARCVSSGAMPPAEITRAVTDITRPTVPLSATAAE
jgi:CBS domain-containing protein